MSSRLEKKFGQTPLLILGYGREGQCIHRYLLKQMENPQISVADGVMEVELVEGASANTTCFLGSEHRKAISRFNVIFRSPGIPMDLPELLEAKTRGAAITSLTQLFFEEARQTIIGVTGTKGKSTTSSLIHHILSTAGKPTVLLGNIGKPALDYLEASEGTIFVLELSSFQLEDLSFSPKIAVLLDVVPEHLDHHGDFERYLEAKLRILEFQNADGLAVLGISSSHYAKSAKVGSARRVLYDNKSDSIADIFLDGFEIRSRNRSRPIISLEDIRLRGPGNVNNVLAACSTALALNVPVEVIQSALRSFSPLPHRLELLGTYRGIDFYNDSLATIPQATLNALDGLGNQIQTLILGGFDRGLDMTPLADGLIRHLDHIETLILFPTTGEKILERLNTSLQPHQQMPRILHCNSMAEAVRHSYATTFPGRICLLSPAASSFNMFKDYQERGDAFRQEVMQQAKIEERSG